MPGDRTENNGDLAVRAAWLSFVGGRTQGEIAQRLGVSAAKVHRLIAQAQRDGLVRFHIEGRPAACLQLEEQFVRRFELNNCVIAPDLSGERNSEEQQIGAVGAAAGQFLAGLLAAADIQQIGVGMGRTLAAAVSAMPKIARPDLRVVSISGSLMQKLSANPYDVVQQLAERCGGEGYFLPVPYFARDVAERDMFLAQPSVQELLRLARGSDVFVVGIGSLESGGHLVSRRIITPRDQETLTRAGAVGDLMGRFLNIDGELVHCALGNCAVGLHYHDVRGARVVALAAGASKAAATLSALRAGVVSDLIIDETLAEALAQYVDTAASSVGKAALKGNAA